MQAGDILRVPRPFLIRLLEEGQYPVLTGRQSMHVAVVAAQLYKALPVWIVLNSGLANSLVIDSEIAEIILSTEKF